MLTVHVISGHAYDDSYRLCLNTLKNCGETASKLIYLKSITICQHCLSFFFFFCEHKSNGLERL